MLPGDELQSFILANVRTSPEVISVAFHLNSSVHMLMDQIRHRNDVVNEWRVSKANPRDAYLGVKQKDGSANEIYKNLIEGIEGQVGTLLYLGVLLHELLLKHAMALPGWKDSGFRLTKFTYENEDGAIPDGKSFSGFERVYRPKTEGLK